jgi:hypothetical protein
MSEDLYEYRGVPIPPLGMVDDIISVTNVNKTQEMNRLINTFIESKKLRLSKKKCFQIHIGKGHDNCPKLKVHEDIMKEAEREKYLGDVICEKDSIQATIENRKAKGQGIISEILSIIGEIPLGKHTTTVALKLREVMLLNGILFNSEAWHGVTKKHIKSLEVIDQQLLRGILKAHGKTPSEFLYLETGGTPIRWIISQRRVNYLKCILEKDDNELVKKVYLAQQDRPAQGDFAQLVKSDLNSLNITEAQVKALTKTDLKKLLKSSATTAALNELKEIQGRHNKIKHIKYEKLEIQPYLTNPRIYNSDKHTLTAVRSQCVRNVRMNFQKMYKYRLSCPLQCNREAPQPDTQRHLLICPKLNTEFSKHLSIDQANGQSKEQEQIAPILSKLLRQRTRILEETQDTSLPGAFSDHSNLFKEAAAII